VLVVVDAVVAVGARGLGQQLLALVVPDGFDRRVRDLGQFSDFHDAANEEVGNQRLTLHLLQGFQSMP
jgi:hypothetical protein